jgi:hypothetical protein
MSESNSKSMRAILPLLKGQVIDRGDFGFKIAIGGSTTITVQLNHPHLYDIKDGDLLTLYCEVLLAKPQG